MKKICFLVIFTLITTCLFAQSSKLYLNESFDNPGWPEGWERIMNWSASPTQDAALIRVVNNNTAGGTPEELEFTYVGPNTAGKYGRALSKVLPPNVPVSVILQFLYSHSIHPDDVATPTKVGVGTTLDDGATWNILWERSHTEGTSYPTPPPQFVLSEEVESPDFGKANCRLVFYFYCESEIMATRRWQIDNVRLYTPINYDASLLTIDGVTEIIAQGKKEVGFTFVNKGIKTITSLEASYQLEGGAKVTEVFTGLSVAQDAELSLMFSEKVLLGIDNYKITVSIDKINGENDEEPEDNVKSMNIKSYMTFGEQRLVIDHFTSSMCSPCVNANQQMKAFLADHPNETVITKYQMPIPQSGDIYNFPDGDTRRYYYGVSGVPDIYFNGEQIIRDDFEKRFNQYFATQVPVVEVRGNWNMDADYILSADFNVAAYDDIQDAVIHVTVNKKRTVGNTGNNGETEFFHVMMKMLPDGNGTSANFSKYDVKDFNFSYDMKLVRENLAEIDKDMDNFEVTVFVQNKTTKRIYNGNWLLERSDLVNTPPSDLTLTLIETNFEAKWKAPDNEKFTGYNIYINDVKVANNISQNSFTSALPIDDACVVKVSAVYPENVESVRIVVYSPTIGINKYVNDAQVLIFPNPADNQITIKAEKIMKNVEVYNTLGQLQNRINLNTNNYTINVANYNSGIYFVKIMFEDGSSANKKVIVR